MILHTESLDQARPTILRHGSWFRAVVMTALVSQESSVKARRNMYVSAALITPWSWLREHGETCRDSRFGIIDRHLKNGGSAGASFNAMPGLRCRQNRLLLCEVPAWVVPPAIRKMVDGEHDTWRIELYSLGGLDGRTMRFGQYGVFVEFVPASLPLPKRVALGVRSMWYAVRKNTEFVRRLLNNRNTSKRLFWHRLAFWAGQAKAGALLLVLVAVLLASRRHTTL